MERASKTIVKILQHWKWANFAYVKTGCDTHFDWIRHGAMEVPSMSAGVSAAPWLMNAMDAERLWALLLQHAASPSWLKLMEATMELAVVLRRALMNGIGLLEMALVDAERSNSSGFYAVFP